MKKLKVLVFLFIFNIMAFSAAIEGKVVKVADGDTITILLANNTKERIRFSGIDAPESTQEYGIKSLDVLKKLIDNKNVKVEIVEKDMYGRIVGTVYYQNKNINLHMVETGNAWFYKQYAKGNTEYEKAEKNARDKKIGLWQTKNPVAPWDYRKNKKTISKEEVAENKTKNNEENKENKEKKDDSEKSDLYALLKSIQKIINMILKLMESFK